MAVLPCDSTINAQGRELKEHGAPLFPVACYYDTLPPDIIPWHWHDELEVGYVVQGCPVLAVGSEKRSLHPGEGFFVNANVLHTNWCQGGEVCQIHSAVFQPRLVGGSMDSVFWQRYLHPLIDNQSFPFFILSPEVDWQRQALDALVSAWQACAEESPGFEFQVREGLSKLICLLALHQPTPQQRPSEKALRDAGRIKLMLRYIQENYSQELNTALIAHSALISESECLRCFHSTIGVTPIQYVRQLRAQQAADLLASTDLKITDVGTRCGFQEMGYFTKTFRSFYGCTPSEYRRRLKEPNLN